MSSTLAAERAEPATTGPDIGVLSANEAAPKVPTAPDMAEVNARPLNVEVGTVANVKQEQTVGSEALSIEGPNPDFATKPAPVSRKRFIARGKWVGTVVDVGEETFTAILRPLLGDSVLTKAEVLFDNLSRDEASLVVDGAQFVWTIGHYEGPSGVRNGSSIIRFRRLPAWTDREIQQARAKADLALELFGPSEHSSAKAD